MQDNDLIVKESWIKKNWKWFLALAIVFLLLLAVILSSTSQKGISDLASAYNDHSLHEKAIDLANTNKEVQEIIGKINPIDKLAILEGNAIYSNNNNTVSLSIRITGAKKNGKLDIDAVKKGSEWHYTKIIVRTKKPKEEIIVVDK
ncbi:cytochrome c oxidase assembly factor Coa1 family protein [Flavobacterium hercynium]|uniref:Cytochrome oxidase complex assembly protein 1 n=1 Tax=Flavobacterium hercynium TaxID=387094 RepID=A0A226GYZ0_9FLAO|nr:cytochrome c oxidase assembly factor Coa1 family protein [Flavobacterium hercynium]OXA86788.1 hypothetical protein B0A66_17460 [Flavobacterium hercynium]SMP26989.1 Cytochrome oxidase complex assembly protein 1 [Flavobacterium hercynium]